MATIKFPSEMPAASDVGGNDKLMISKDGSGEAFQVSFNDVKQYLEITDIELSPVQGGASEESPTIISAGPAGQNRKMDASPGWYSVGGQTVEAAKGTVWKWFWNGTTWSLVDMGELPQVDTSGLVAKSELGIAADGYIDYTSFIVVGKVLDSNGAELNNAASSIIRDMPLQSGQTQITFSNMPATTLKKIVFKNSEGDIISPVRDFGTMPRTVPIPTGATVVSYSLKRVEDATTPDLRVNYGSVVPELYLESVEGYSLRAKMLSEDNEAPAPVSPKNAVNKEYFDQNAVRNADITSEVVYSETNKLDPSYLQTGKTLDSSGNVITTIPQHAAILNHPISEYAGVQVTIAGILQNDLKKWVFRNSEGVVLGGVSSLTTVPMTITVPATAVTMDISVDRPGEPLGANAQARMSIGSEIYPYDPFRAEYVISIKGKEIRGGNGKAYDQDLNTTDDVAFASVKTSVLDMVAWSVNLPEWNGTGTPPVELSVGDAYATPDGVIKWRTGNEG